MDSSEIVDMVHNKKMGGVISAEDMHFYGLAALHNEFATVINSEELLKLIDTPNLRTQA